MARPLSVAAEDAGQHPAFGSHLPNLRDLLSTSMHRVKFRAVAPCLANVDAIQGIEAPEERRADVACAEGGLDDPEPAYRMLPLARQPSDCVCDFCSASGAVEFTCNNVAVHVKVFRAWGFD